MTLIARMHSLGGGEGRVGYCRTARACIDFKTKWPPSEGDGKESHARGAELAASGSVKDGLAGRLEGTTPTLLTDHTSCVLQQFNGGLLPETRREKEAKENQRDRRRQREREKEMAGRRKERQETVG